MVGINQVSSCSEGNEDLWARVTAGRTPSSLGFNGLSVGNPDWTDLL